MLLLGGAQPVIPPNLYSEIVDNIAADNFKNA